MAKIIKQTKAEQARAEQALQDGFDAQACDIKRLEVHIKAAVVELKVLRQALVTNNIHWFAVKTVDGVVDDLESQIED